jgi:tetratricopeptide (TPR) repeat protein
VRRVLPVLVVLVLAAACAAKTAPPPPSPVAPRYPGYLFPAVPPALTTSPAAPLYEQGWRSLQAGDLRAAEREFAIVLKQTPAFFPAEAALGYVALARRETRAAVGRFDRALTAAPAYVPALVGKGEALLAAGREEDALASFELALAAVDSPAPAPADASREPDAGPLLDDLRTRVEALRLKIIEQQIAAARKDAEAGRLDAAREGYRDVLAVSPDSAFLYRELADVEQRLGRLDDALNTARRATELDPGDARAFAALGDIQEARAEFQAAARSYDQAAAIEPAADYAARADRARERAELAKLPVAYHAIPSSPAITRGELAALLGVRLDELLARSRRRSAVVITDMRGYWASTWILAVARAGVMEVYPNHTFQPGAAVRRSELAEVVSRALEAIVGAPGSSSAARDPRIKDWREARPRFVDLAPGHPAYGAAALAVSSGAMAVEGQAFQLTRPVSGGEAVAAVERLVAIWKRRL